MSQFVIDYDSRSDSGPSLVGPFPSRDAAQDYADSLRGPGWEASYCICELAAPTALRQRKETPNA